MQKPITTLALTAGLVLTALWVAPRVSAEAFEVHSPKPGVRYVTGGVSDSEQKVLREAAGEYDLYVTLASEQGAYLADVTLTLKSAAGEQVLEADPAGPLFLADLPDGDYVIQASAEGWKQERHRVTIDDAHQMLHVTLEPKAPSGK